MAAGNAPSNQSASGGTTTAAQEGPTTLLHKKLRTVLHAYVARESYLIKCRAIGVPQGEALLMLQSLSWSPDPYAEAWARLATRDAGA